MTRIYLGSSGRINYWMGMLYSGGLWTQRAGGALPLFLGFLVGGLLMIVVGYSYSYMIAKFPVAGGEFAYAYKGFGRTASYICGWMLSLGYLSIVALNATAFRCLRRICFREYLIVDICIPLQAMMCIWEKWHYLCFLLYYLEL